MQYLNEMKPLGAFIENTVRPILAQLKECKTDLSIGDLEGVVKKLVITHIVCLFLSLIRDVSIALIIGWVICTTRLL